MNAPEATAQRRNKGFEETHQQIIDAAVRLISEKGVESLSMSAVARATAINRTTVYYHFESREDLIAAVKVWSSAQITKAVESIAPAAERIDKISRFVLENPELIKLWIEDFLSVGDIRDRYPYWDALVNGARTSLSADPANEGVDAEVYCVMQITSAIIGPRVFKNSVCPDADTETVVRRFTNEWLRLLKMSALGRP
jgi:AcrR family transcriptional regulator